MPRYEYKVVPAPSKGLKTKAAKTPESRFAHAVEAEMNRLAAEGWEYYRAELLPSDERVGLTGSAVHWRNLLVFRKLLETEPARVAPPPLSVPLTDPGTEPLTPPIKATPLRPASGAERILKDTGVEEVSDVSGMTEALRSRAERHKRNDEPEPTDKPS